METSEKCKNWWAPIWCGLATDPKHQEKMGKAVWLYLYIHMYADRKTGKLFRNCEQIAEETGQSWKTINRQLAKLSDGEYIHLTRKSHGFTIEITKFKTTKMKERPDTSVPSLPDDFENRSDTFVRSQGNVIGHFCPRDRTLLSKRPDTFVRSHIRKFKEIYKKDLLKRGGGNGKTDDFDNFKIFAEKTHLKTFSTPLIISNPDREREKVKAMLVQTPLQVLSIAWVLFLRSRDPWLLENAKPRNIPVFSGQYGDYVAQAAQILSRSRARNRNAMARASPAGVPAAGGDLWSACLEKIEGQILPENFSNWVKPIRFGGAWDDYANLICPNKNYKFCLVENYAELIERTLTEVFHRPVKPQFLLQEV